MKKVFLTLVALFLISSISFVNAAESNSLDTDCLHYAESQAHFLECEYGHLSDEEYEETVVFFWGDHGVGCFLRV